MVISTSGAGERPLFVSYVSEVPIWKTTYRLRYTRQLDDQENKLEALRREIAATTSRRDAARQELNVLIGSFSYEG